VFAPKARAIKSIAHATPTVSPVRLLALLVTLLILLACERRTPPSVPSTSPRPARLVPLSPAVAIILRDLGHAPRIVGRHAYDFVLDPALPVCGDQAGIDYEALLRVNPTHVFTQWGARELPERLVALAAERGWTLRDARLLTLADIEATLLDLDAAALDRDPAAPPSPAAALQIARLNEALRPRAGAQAAGRVLLLMSTSPTAAALGPGSFHHQVLERLGAAPALATGAPYITLDAEDLLRLNPDAVVVIAPRAFGAPAASRPATGAALEGRLGILATLPIRALEAGRVALIDDPLALTPSTAIADFATELGRILDAWAAAPADPSARPANAPGVPSDP